LAEIQVSPFISSSTHPISLSFDGVEMGIKLDGGWSSVQQISSSPSNILRTAGGSEFGDHDPQNSHIQMVNYRGGRGTESFRVGQSTYFDAKNAWTLSQDVLLPGMQWHFGIDHKEADMHMPGDLEWRSLYGSTRYVSKQFTSTGVTTADRARVFLKKVGNPTAAVTVAIKNNNGGDPGGTTHATGTLAAASVGEFVSDFWKIDFDAEYSLVASTVYHIVLNGGASDNNDNHWEIGVDPDTSTSKTSSAGSSWTAAAFSTYFRVADTGPKRKWLLKEFKGILIACDVRDSGDNSVLLANGDFGVADASAAAKSVSVLKVGGIEFDKIN